MHLPVRLRVPLAGLAFCSAALLVSACGGSSSKSPTSSGATSVPANAVAIVGAETVPRAELDRLMTQVCVQYKAAKKACPKPGSAERKQLQQSYVAQLVQQAEFDEAGKQLKVVVKDKEVASNLQKLKLQYAKGSDGKVDDAKWKKVLADNHTSEAAVVKNLHNALLRNAIYVDLTKGVTVTDKQVQAYYAKNKKVYVQAATRKVRHILVKSKALADRIYAELATSDAQFATLAKKYSTDTTSKARGGQLVPAIKKGQTVPAFDKVAFSAATGQVSKPVKSAYGWHVIEATADTVPASVRPLDKALKAQIRTTLVTQKKQTVANKWFTTFQKKIEKSVRYAAGLAPPKTTSTPASSTDTTTTAG